MTTSAITNSAERENVLLFGLGGIGGIYACILHLSGKCDVSVVARSNYKAVSEKGFKLVSPKFGDHPSIKFAGGQCRFSGRLNYEFQAYAEPSQCTGIVKKRPSRARSSLTVSETV
jgi:hypothetical protein